MTRPLLCQICKEQIAGETAGYHICCACKDVTTIDEIRAIIKKIERECEARKIELSHGTPYPDYNNIEHREKHNEQMFVGGMISAIARIKNEIFRPHLVLRDVVDERNVTGRKKKMT